MLHGCKLLCLLWICIVAFIMTVRRINRQSKTSQFGDEAGIQRWLIKCKLEPFDLEVESMGAYLEQLELFFKANNVQDESKVAVFLTVIGASN